MLQRRCGDQNLTEALAEDLAVPDGEVLGS